MMTNINGVFMKKENAKISVYDHGLLYGDGVFEGIRIYNGKPFQLEEHVERLYQSAQALLLKIPCTKEILKERVLETVEKSNQQDGYIRLVVTRGEGMLGMNPFACKDPNVIIIVDEIQLYPEEYYQRGIKVITAATRRVAADSLDPRIKSLNYLNNIMAKIEAIQANCFEAILLNHEGYITECTGDNIFVVKKGVVLTPEVSSGALDGITKNTIMQLAAREKINGQEKRLTQYDLYTADEVFLTGTGAEIIPVVEVDGRIVGSGKLGETCQVLQNAFKDHIKLCQN